MKSWLKADGRIRAIACAMVIGLLLSSASSAQQIVSSNQSGQTGTVQQLSQDEGSVTISGTAYSYSDVTTQILLRDDAIGVERLAEGMVVRYTINGAGMLLTVEIIGPADKIREFTNN